MDPLGPSERFAFASTGRLALLASRGPARFARGTVERRRRRLSEFEPDPDVLARVTRCARLVGSKSLVTISRLAVSLVARRYRSVPLGGLLVVEMRRPGFSRAKRARSRATHDRRECVGRDLNRRKTDRSLRSRLRLPGFKSRIMHSWLTYFVSTRSLTLAVLTVMFATEVRRPGFEPGL